MSDFDFLYGNWTVTNRRLRELFVGSNDWEEFPGTQHAQELLGGVGNIDESDFPTKGWSGATLRLQNQETKEWSIWWASSATGTLFPPVVGRFENGRGDFYGDDVHEGRPIRAHFIWSHITPTSARWEQEFSADGGATWESNWVMELTRALEP
jgi:hypothetical protein